MKKIAVTAVAAVLSLSLTGCISLTPVENMPQKNDSEKTEALSETGEAAPDLTLEMGVASMMCPSSWSLDEQDGTISATSEDSTATALIASSDLGTQLSEAEAKTALEACAQSMAQSGDGVLENKEECTVDDIACLKFNYTITGETETARMSAIAFVYGNELYICTAGYKDDKHQAVAEAILASLEIVTTGDLPEQDDASQNSPETESPQSEPSAAPEPERPKTTVSQDNALRTAKDYLNFMAFSHQGLVEQLEYEGFSNEDAVWAADNCGADWMEQAAKSAESYLDLMGFSRSELIDQLEYEGFTSEQAEYGANSVGL